MSGGFAVGRFRGRRLRFELRRGLWHSEHPLWRLCPFQVVFGPLWSVHQLRVAEIPTAAECSIELNDRQPPVP